MNQQNTSLTKSLLRFITCGSVDDGKSTLIGRILYESRLILTDQLEKLKQDSKRFGTSEEELDLSLLVDGLAAEREQGITIDVAYRFFSTANRKFIVADTPGHEQYTRNMATGASTADLAIVIVDASKGILTQTKRHSFILSMLGIKYMILAVNKMDLVGYNQKIFQQTTEDYQKIANFLNIEHLVSIPVSALRSDNIVYKSANTNWYKGPCLLEYLEEVDIKQAEFDQQFCMPVQWINRHHSGFRGFSGKIVSGGISVGDQIKILPSEKHSKITQIITYDCLSKKAFKGEAITIILEDQIDISRGDLLISEQDLSFELANQFEANILWMHQKALIPGRQYIIQLHTDQTLCTINKPKYKIDINTFAQISVKTLEINEIGVCDVYVSKKLAFLPYKKNRELGSFILIDRLTNETVAAGMIIHSLRRATNIHAQQMFINPGMRSAIKQQQSCVVWLTGISGAGKSTIANILEKKLHETGKHTTLLDGDNLRLGLSKDLGFSTQDRIENIRRAAEVSKLMKDSGLIVLVAVISPFKAERDMAKQIIGERFFEIFIDTELKVAEARDPKDLYKKARTGCIYNFTGIDSPYEIPLNPELILKTKDYSAELLADKVINLLNDKDIL